MRATRFPRQGRTDGFENFLRLFTAYVVCLVAMASKKKAEAEKEQPKEAAGEAVPQKAAKTSVAAPTPPTKKKIGKLVKKAKQRLPRKEKKRAKKKLS